MIIDVNGPNSAERPPCVLNVDGDPAVLYTRTRVLRAAGYAVVEAGSSAEALRLASETTLDLVLLDVLLPDMDGHEVCRHLKAHYPDLPLIEVSARFNDSPAERVLGLSCGADMCLPVPLDPKELVAAVAARLRLRHTEAVLRDSEALLTQVLDVLPAGVWIMNAEGRIVHSNPAGEQIWAGARYVPVEQFGEYKGWWADTGELIAPEEWAAARAFRKGETSIDEEIVIQCFDGTRKTILNSAMPLHDTTGRISGAVIANVDITARKMAETELMASEERLRLAQEVGGIGHWDWDIKSGAVTWSGSLYRFLGLNPGEISSRSAFTRIIHPDDRDSFEHAVDAALSGERSYDVEFRIVRRTDGAVHWLAGKGEVIRDASGTPLRMIGINYDITERKTTEMALQVSEKRSRQRLLELQAIYETAPVGLCILDTELRFQRVNARLAEINGVPAADHLGRTVREVVPGIADQTEALARQILESGEPIFDVEIAGETAAQPGSERHWVESWLPLRDAEGRIVGINVVAEEVTERKRAEAERRRLNEMLEQRVAEATAQLRAEMAERERAEMALHQAQKLEAVGQLTGGVAHDFNNLLAAVLGNLELLERYLAKDSAGLRLVYNAARAAERGAALTRQLLAFSRKQPIEPKLVDVNALVSGMGEMLERTIGASIRIDRLLAPRLPAVTVDPNQLELAILNLVVNARDAMPLGGTLTIDTAVLTVEDRRARPAGLAAGEYVRIAVADTGHGMAPEIAEHAFEPFFTTKEPGKGTGLGLAMVYGVAQQAGGMARIESALGHGTRIEIWLPAASAQPSAVPLLPEPRLSAEKTAPPPVRGAVLVVDDDADVRELAAACLRELGCTVFEASGGPVALEILKREQVDLLIADFAMPVMSGAELAQRAREQHPGLPILLMTGYAELGARSALPADVPTLKKPFRLAELTTQIRELLPTDGSGTGGATILPLPVSPGQRKPRQAPR